MWQRSIQTLENLITAWRISRQYGAARRLRRNGDLKGALNAALDGVAKAARSALPLFPAAGAVLTPMLELTMIADEVAEDVAIPAAALPALIDMVDYWDRAVSAHPALLDFEHARERIAYLRRRAESLKRH